MKFQYLGEKIEAELLTNVSDYGDSTEQVLVLRNLMFEKEAVRWSVLVKKGSEPPWSCLFDALGAALWSGGGIIRRYKKRMIVRRAAKYITGNAKGASAKSLRKAVLDAMGDFKMKVDAIKKQEEKEADLRCTGCGMVETHSLQCPIFNGRGKQTELLPCPNCGCTDITLMSLHEHEYIVKDSDNPYWVVCDSCRRYSTSWKTAEEAINAWNEEATKTKMDDQNGKD